jgi:hypothetical protein
VPGVPCGCLLASWPGLDAPRDRPLPRRAGKDSNRLPRRGNDASSWCIPRERISRTSTISVPTWVCRVHTKGKNLED